LGHHERHAITFSSEAVIDRLKEKNEKLLYFRQSKTTSLLCFLFRKNSLRIEKDEKNFQEIKNSDEGSAVYKFFEEFNIQAEQDLKTVFSSSKLDAVFAKVYGCFLKEKTTSISNRQQFLTFLEMALFMQVFLFILEIDLIFVLEFIRYFSVFKNNRILQVSCY